MQAMWGNPTIFHLKNLLKNIEKRQILTQSIKKSFLVDPLTTNNAIYRDLSTLSLELSRVRKKIKLCLTGFRKNKVLKSFKALPWPLVSFSQLYTFTKKMLIFTGVSERNNYLVTRWMDS